MYHLKDIDVEDSTAIDEWRVRSAVDGNPGDQHFYADALATGVMGVPRDEAHSIVMDVFAFNGGNSNAATVLGYRHINGYGVPMNCSRSFEYYSAAAEFAVMRNKKRRAWPSSERIRLSSLNSHGKKSQADIDFEIVQYYQHLADTGNVDALRIIGTYLQYGLHGMGQNLQLAREYTRRAVDLGDSKATSVLGRMYLFGIGGEMNHETARELFEKSDDKSDSMVGLCYMHLHGFGGFQRDRTKAKMLCGLAVEVSPITDQAHSDALHILGDIYSNEDQLQNLPPNSIGSHFFRDHRNLPHIEGTDFSQALKHYLLANKSGIVGNYEALYKAGLMYKYGHGTAADCKTAVATLATVALQGLTASYVLAAQELFLKGKFNEAMVLYARAAEAGDELAQSNVAWLLEHGHCNGLPAVECEEAALRFYYRASMHDNGASFLKIGDFHYYGKASLPQNYEEAYLYYQRSAERRIPQALFNMGWMYSHGLGVPLDFMLANRHYKNAVEISPEAKFPVQLSLLEMYFRIYLIRWGPAVNEFLFNEQMLWKLIPMVCTLICIILINLIMKRR